MVNDENILQSIKKMLDIDTSDTDFDEQLLIHINSMVASLTQMGVGPANGFNVTANSIWSEFIGNSNEYASIKSYIYMKVCLIFDPPTNSAKKDAFEYQISEFEWRARTNASLKEIDASKINKNIPIKISDLLYSKTYKELNYNFGKKFIEEHYKDNTGACTCVRSGNFVGRNFDMFYNWYCDFIVKVESSKNNYASIGVASNVPGLTKQFMDRKVDSDTYEAIPFMLVDGINEHGLFVGMNIVHADKGITTGTVPLISKRDSICSTMLPRYILDHYKTAKEAAESIRDYISVYSSKSVKELDSEIHLMLSDNTSNYIVEFVNNEVKIIQSNEPNYSALTNFYLYDVIFNNDNKVYTPETQDETHNAIITNNINAHGQGLERWNIVIDNIALACTKANMIDLLKSKLNYNLAYTLEENKWYTEFTGEYSAYGDITVASSKEDYATILEKATSLFTNRDRDMGKYGVWHTTHTSIYDLVNKCLYIYDSTEDGKEHTFYLN